MRDLSKMMKKADVIAQAIKGSLEKVPGIQYAFICGPLPKTSWKNAIDVIVLGGHDLLKVEETISKVEEESKRAIRITSFTVREFRERMKAKDQLVSRALRGAKVMLIGDEEEMIKI
jgi:hypothetical protein